MTIQQAIEAKIGKKNFEFRQGTRIVRRTDRVTTARRMIDEEVNVKEAVDEAKDADVVVLCLGEGSYTETPGNLTDLTLPETQFKFAEADYCDRQTCCFGFGRRSSARHQPDRRQGFGSFDGVQSG